MPHTKEQRNFMALCGARKKSGETCRAFAGQGTDHLGVGRCKYHLGNTKSHKANAVIQEARAHVAKFGNPIQMRPHEALLAMLHLAVGHAAYLGDALEDVGSLSSEEGRAIGNLWGAERDRVAKTAKAALDAGVQERQVRLAEGYGRQLANVLRSIFSDPELALTEEQQDALPTILRRHLGDLERFPAQLALASGE